MLKPLINYHMFYTACNLYSHSCVLVRIHSSRPVLLSSKHKHSEQLCGHPEGSSKLGCAQEDGERVLQCMKWGLVPGWHKGDPTKFGTMLNNCRFDSIEFGTEKPSFRGALHKGQRCVVVADG